MWVLRHSKQWTNAQQNADNLTNHSFDFRFSIFWSVYKSVQSLSVSRKAGAGINSCAAILQPLRISTMTAFEGTRRGRGGIFFQSYSTRQRSVILPKHTRKQITAHGRSASNIINCSSSGREPDVTWFLFFFWRNVEPF
jgi:hypothetical protein